MENVVRCPKFPLERTSSGEMNPRDAQKVFFKCYFLRKLGKSVVKPCHQSTLLLLTNGAVNINFVHLAAILTGRLRCWKIFHSFAVLNTRREILYLFSDHVISSIYWTQRTCTLGSSKQKQAAHLLEAIVMGFGRE